MASLGGLARLPASGRLAAPCQYHARRAQELGSFLQTESKTQLVVDRSPQGDLLRLNFNVSFPSLPCEFASLDVSDALGTVRPGPAGPQPASPRCPASSPPWTSPTPWARCCPAPPARQSASPWPVERPALRAWMRVAPCAPGHAPCMHPQQARHGAVRAAHAPRTSSAPHAGDSRLARRARRSA